MGRQVCYIELGALERLTLEDGLSDHRRSEFQKHCQMLLFSAKARPAKQITLLLDSNYQSVINYLNNWQQKGLVELM